MRWPRQSDGMRHQRPCGTTTLVTEECWCAARNGMQVSSSAIGSGVVYASSPDISEMDRVVMVTSSLMPLTGVLGGKRT